MPPGTTEQTASITISTTGRLVFNCINIGFIFSLLGALQALALVLGLIVTCLIGFSVSFDVGKLATIGGYTFYVILLPVGFWCLLTTGFIYISSTCSLVTSTLLPKTIFFILYNAVAAVFYLICSISCLGEATPFRWTFNNYDVRPIVLAASVFGIITGSVYVIITIISFFMYRRGSVTTPS